MSNGKVRAARVVATAGLIAASVLVPGGLPRAGAAGLAQPGAADAAGAALFRERCADCHGADARGGSGPSLVGLWASGATDERVFQTIRQGIPGSIMPASRAPDADIHAIVVYLKSVGSTARSERPLGSSARGRELFDASCRSCHRVDGRGGRLGPDLSRIADTLPAAELRRAIRQPSASIASGFNAITLVTRDGRQIKGLRKGEDAFSIQIMDMRERLQGYRQADLREVIRDPRSSMPEYGPDRLSDDDLEALLSFLGTLRTGAAGNRSTRP